MAVRWRQHGRLAILGLAVLAAPGVRAAAPPGGRGYPNSIRRPRGIYAVVVPDQARKGSEDPDALLDNPAVSGLAIRMFWASLQPSKDRYDFSKIDAAFASAAARHKSVQLVLLPGFGTPQWVLDELTSCDGLGTSTHAGSARSDKHAAASKGERGGAGDKGKHEGRGKKGEKAPPGGPTEAASAPCGMQTFEVSEGRRQGESQPLPLPWSPVYKRYWKAFLTDVASRYGVNEAFVSIAVTGPTAESAEIILPRTGDQLERWAQLLELSYHDPSYHRTDKAFIDEWKAAVTMFGEVFRNVTLVLTRGSGLLNFTKGQSEEAQAAIVASFGGQPVGSNAKATQTSGLKACRETKGGIRGVKEMAADGSLSPAVLGGAQFDTSFSAKPAAEGCAASCDMESPACRSLTPRDAFANVLHVYFDGTPAGGDFGASRGAAQMNYLQVYAPDVVYAGTQPAVQKLLDQASQVLLRQAR
jgi:hypothetical protein